MGQALSMWSRKFYKRVFGHGIYDQPALQFRPVIERHVSEMGPSPRVLDAACGYNNSYIGAMLDAGMVERSNLIGTDIDGDVVGNNPLHDNIIIQDLHVPLPIEPVDAVISQYTWEHLHDPATAMKSLNDRLNPGGKLMIIAPQKYDYVSIIERMLPQRLKNLSWKLMKGRDVMPYPAFFRLCTETELRDAAKETGLELVHYEALACPPIWFKKIPPVFVLLCGVMSLFNRFRVFKPLRSTFLAILEKPAASI